MTLHVVVGSTRTCRPAHLHIILHILSAGCEVSSALKFGRLACRLILHSITTHDRLRTM